MSTTTIAIDELRELGKQVLLKHGATEREAEIITEDYLDADLRGRSSHGFTFFKYAVAAFEGRGTYEALPIDGSYLQVNGNSDLGHIVAREAIDRAIPVLSERKVVTIGISDITRFNCSGIIARYGAEKGAITLVFAYGGSSVVAPPGGKAPAVNNTPIGIAIPYTDPLFVLDMATSERAWGHLTLAKYSKKNIPVHWGVNEDGLPTDDPSEVKWLSPLGGYKGFGLALAFEILGGALVRVPIGTKGPGKNRGTLIQLIDPSIFGHTADSFREQVTSFLAELSEIPTTDPNQTITYPGQRSEQRYIETLNSGVIELHQSVIDYLHEQLRTKSHPTN
ncbi:Ldh family oxidoreductase [Metabacillus fastidiosus]|uniref:Ldh family oxidoreductase n=1 Tax=Metabacillus fastidiosus TaxID=1458 RepID=UPI003D27C280